LFYRFQKNPWKKNGLLRASDVAMLKMNADFVVLSACNTAAGDKPGAEALSGLARAILVSESGATGETKKAAQRFSAIGRLGSHRGMRQDGN
jgi:hypothetical protein